ncbi:MAG: hypothetical protein HGA49_10810 [Eubacteriaceae bacterium]|nr:hypothetical protein [Eubacteriaceae bacterium]
MSNKYEKIGRNYALSGKKKDEINVSDIFDKKERDKIKTDIEEVIALYDNMLSENQKKIDDITAVIKDKENDAVQFRCKEGVLVTMRELLIGLSMLLINIAFAAIVIERKIDFSGMYKYIVALLSPILMVFLSYLTSYFVVKGWRKINPKTFRVIFGLYFGICSVLFILLLLDVGYVVDYLLYLTSLIYPIYLMARIFMVSNLVEKKGHLTELMLVRNDIEKRKSDGVADLNGKLSKAIEEDLQNERSFWLGYAFGKSLT